MEKEIENWWQQAERDLDTANYLFDGKRYKEASFFCQQAAEKALKALLLKKEAKIIKIHDLVKLAQLVNISDDLLTDCEKLTFVYVDTRYPDTGKQDYTLNETKADVERAKRILQWVEKNI